MNGTQVTLISLAQADDNDLSDEFSACLALIEQDIRARQDVKQSRKLTLTLTMKPNADGTALMEINVAASLPKRGPEVRTIKLTKNGLEMGSDPKNPDQKTIFDGEPPVRLEETPSIPSWKSKRDEVLAGPVKGAKVKRTRAGRARKGSK